jgi:hypothetical protein
MATRPRRFLRVLAWLTVSLLLSVVVLLLVLRSDRFGLWLARLAEATIAAETGERALISSVDVDPLHGRLQLRGLVLSHRDEDPGRDGATLLAAESVAVTMELRDGRPALRRVELARPVLHLHIDPDGLRELPGRRGGGGGGDDAEVELPWRELWVYGGAVRVDGPDWLVSAEGVSVTPEAQPGRQAVDVDRVRLGYRGAEQRSTSVHFGGVRIGGGVVELPEVALRFPDLDVSGAVAVYSGRRYEGDLNIRLDLAALNPLTLPGVGLSGVIRADAELGGTVDEPAFVGSLISDGLSVARHQQSGDLLYDPGPMRSSWGLHGRVVSFGPLATRFGDGLLVASGSYDLASTGFQVTVAGEDLSLYDAFQQGHVNPAPWVDLRLDAELQGAGTLSPLRIFGSFDIAARDLVVRSGPARDPSRSVILGMPAVALEGQLDLDPDRLRLLARRIYSRGSSGRVDALIDFAGDGDLDVQIDLPVLWLEELRPLGGVELGGSTTAHLRLSGPYSRLALSGDLAVRDFSLAGIPLADELRSPVDSANLRTLRFTDLQGRRRDTDYAGSLDLDFVPPEGRPGPELDLALHLDPGRLRDLTSMFLDLGDLDASVAGTMTLRGAVDALEGDMELALSDIDLYGERFPTGSFRGAMRAGRFTMPELSMERGGAALLARGSVDTDWSLNIDVLSSGLRLETLDHLAPSEADWRGRLELDARVGGTLFAPEPHGRLALRDTWIGTRSVGDSTVYFDSEPGLLRYTGGLAGDELGVEGTLALEGEGAWTLAADADAFRISTFYPSAVDGTPITGTLTGRATAAGALSSVGPPLRFDVWADAVAIGWSGHQLGFSGPVPWHWHQDGSTFALSGVQLSDGDATRVTFSGERDEQGNLQLQGGGDIELDLLRAVVPGLERAAGLARVEVEVAGPRGGAQPVVRACVTNGLIQGDWFPEAVEDIHATLVGTADGYEIRGVSDGPDPCSGELAAKANGRLGGGTWTGGGRIDAEGWAPERYELSVDVADARVRYLDFLPPLVGDAHIGFDGPKGALLLSGQIDVVDMLFADRIDWEDWVLEVSGGHLAGAAAAETSDYFAIDLNVKADETIRVRNNMGDFVASADLHFEGNTARPGMVGDVRARPGGRVYLKEREFEIARTELHFVDPYTYDPDLDVALGTEVRTRDDRYNIDYRVTGAYSDWRAETRSDPPLPEADINALLVFGMTTEELDRYGGLTGALAAEGSDLLASKLGIVESMGQGVGSIFGIDVLRPERIDLVSGVNERGSGTISSEVRVLAEWDVGWGTTFIYEQNAVRPRDLYLGFEKRLARKLYLRSYWATEQVGRTLPINGAVGLETNLRWEFD